VSKLLKRTYVVAFTVSVEVEEISDRRVQADVQRRYPREAWSDPMAYANGLCNRRLLHALLRHPQVFERLVRQQIATELTAPLPDDPDIEALVAGGAEEADYGLAPVIATLGPQDQALLEHAAESGFFMEAIGCMLNSITAKVKDCTVTDMGTPLTIAA
jgi:hypothetical protein